ncbi:MAG TPA: DUF2905 domain-containing protein [Burkholderiales bacterium]|nr:DUF2905 domain-containing protein [Burkholderiales bacterium]
MLKWLITLFIALVVLSAAQPWFSRLGIGRLPGDLRIPLRGRIYYVPFASTVALSLALYLIGRLL